MNSYSIINASIEQAQNNYWQNMQVNWVTFSTSLLLIMRYLIITASLISIFNEAPVSLGLRYKLNVACNEAATNVKMYADLYSTRNSTLTPMSTVVSLIEGKHMSWNRKLVTAKKNTHSIFDYLTEQKETKILQYISLQYIN